MTFRELYICNNFFTPRLPLLIRIAVNEKCEIVKEIEICAFQAKYIYGAHEIAFFENDVVTLWNKCRP